MTDIKELKGIAASLKPGTTPEITYDSGTDLFKITWAWYGLPGVPRGVPLTGGVAITADAASQDGNAVAVLLHQEVEMLDRDLADDLKMLYTEGWAALQAQHVVTMTGADSCA